MDEARSILKDCGEFITQATSTIPHSMKVAQAGGSVSVGGGGVVVPSSNRNESMDTTGGNDQKVRG